MGKSDRPVQIKASGRVQFHYLTDEEKKAWVAKLMPVHKEMQSRFGKDFIELLTLFARYRGDRRSCLLIGIQRGEEMMLNPIADEAGPIIAGDQLILLSRVILGPTQPLPIAGGEKG